MIETEKQGVRRIVGQRPAVLAACAEWRLPLFYGVILVFPMFDLSILFIFLVVFLFPLSG